MSSTIKKRIMNMIGIILIIIIVALLIYMDWSKKDNIKKASTAENTSEVQKLLDKNLEDYYPETPREVIKLYSAMTKVMYSGIKDEEIDALSEKILVLYDDEFRQNNPQEQYKKNLYSEIAAWNKAGRKITNYLFVNEDQDTEQLIDGSEYAIVSVSYTIMEKSKAYEVHKFILRKSEDGRWKILGWDSSPGNILASGEN